MKSLKIKQELSIDIGDNTKRCKDLELMVNNKMKEVSILFNDNFKNLNEKIENFNKEEVKLNIENQELMKLISNKMIQTDKKINNIVNDFNDLYAKLEKINTNFKETNKFFVKIKEIDKKLKDIVIKNNLNN